MGREEVASGAEHSRFFGFGHSGFRWAEIFVCPGFDLDENERAVWINYDQIDLAGLAAKIARKRFKAFMF